MVLPERGLTEGKRPSEQSGCGGAPTVVTKVTYCIPLGSFTSTVEVTSLGSWGFRHGTPTRRRRHESKFRAAADLRATPPAAGPLDVDSGLLTSVLATGELGT